MELKLLSDGVVEVGNGAASVLLATQIVKVPKASSGNILVGMFDENAEQIVNSPGEYQFSDVEVVALEVKGNKDGSADLYKLSTGDGGVLFTSVDPKLIGKAAWDLIGEVNVLLIDTRYDLPGVQGFVSKVAPNAIVILGSDNKDEVEKLTGLTVTAKSDSVKLSAKSLQEEEPITQLHMLVK